MSVTYMDEQECCNFHGMVKCYRQMLRIAVLLSPVHTCESNVRMCGQDCEPVLHYLQMVCVPFTTNQNLSVFCANTKGIECTGCPVFASGSRKINLPHTWRKLFGSHVCTGLYAVIFCMLLLCHEYYSLHLQFVMLLR